MRKPVEVMAQQVARHCPPHHAHGPAAFKTAEAQLDALKEAGYIVVPRIELSRLEGRVNLTLPRDETRDNLPESRIRKSLATIRALIDPENDDA